MPKVIFLVVLRIMQGFNNNIFTQIAKYVAKAVYSD